MHPSVTLQDIDARLEREEGRDPDESDWRGEEALNRQEAIYKSARQQAVLELLQDRPLSPDCAASFEDVAPSHGDSAVYLRVTVDADARNRHIRRWNRSTERSRPLEDPETGTDHLLLTSPARFREQPSFPVLERSAGYVPSCLSVRERRRRILRMHAVARHLRRQFHAIGQPAYIIDTKRRRGGGGRVNI